MSTSITGLPPLQNLNEEMTQSPTSTIIAKALQGNTTQTTAPAASATASPSSTASTVASAIGTAAVNALVPDASLFNISLSRAVAIGLGILLIAAAIFSFRPVRETVIEGAKTAG